MDTPEEKQVRINKISTILNYVGGTLIFLGLVYLLERNWGFVAAIIRDIFTLAIASWAIITASRQITQGRETTSTGALFLFGGFLLSMGLYTVAGSMGLLARLRSFNPNNSARDFVSSFFYVCNYGTSAMFYCF